MNKTKSSSRTKPLAKQPQPKSTTHQHSKRRLTTARQHSQRKHKQPVDVSSVPQQPPDLAKPRFFSTTNHNNTSNNHKNGVADDDYVFSSYADIAADIEPEPRGPPIPKKHPNPNQFAQAAQMFPDGVSSTAQQLASSAGAQHLPNDQNPNDSASSPSPHTRSQQSGSTHSLPHSTSPHLQFNPNDTTSSASSISLDEDEVPLPPERYRFPIPPQKLRRLPYVNTVGDALLNPITHLNPFNFVFPDYSLLMDFNEKESLLEWNIVTDAELNGTSEASIAWGTAKNPITGESMRTLVFQGRLGDIILPKSVMHQSKATESIRSIVNSFRTNKKSVLENHSRLITEIAQDPDIDFGEYNAVDADGNPVEDPRVLGPDGKETMFSQGEFGAVHGFVGLMSPSFKPPLDLQWWDTLNICVRTDNGPWMASAKPASVHQDELYMAGIPGPAGIISNPRKTTGFLRRPMRNLFVPISSLSVTKAGKGTKYADFSSNHIYDSFGFSIRGPAGPFKIEIGWIAAARAAGHLQRSDPFTAPETTLKVKLTPEEVQTTTTLNDEQLFFYAHQQKHSKDAEAKQRAIQHVNETPESALFANSAVVNVDEIAAGRLTPQLRKAQLAAKLGVPIDQIQDLEQDRYDPVAIPFDPTVQNHPDLPQEAIDTIDKMTKILEPTHTRQGRSDYGIVHHVHEGELTQEDMERRNERVKNNASFFKKLRVAGEKNPLELEEDLLDMQRKAQLITGSDVPLIVPSYSDELVMAQARIETLQAGLMTEQQWETYTTSEQTHDQMKHADRMQELEQKRARLEFENAYPNTKPAEFIRAFAKEEKEEARMKFEAQRAEDLYYQQPGQLHHNYEFDQVPPRDIFDVMERNSTNFVGDRPEYKLGPDGYPTMDHPDLSTNYNQGPSFFNPKMIARMEQEELEARQRYEARMMAEAAQKQQQQPASSQPQQQQQQQQQLPPMHPGQSIDNSTISNGGNGTKH